MIELLITIAVVAIAAAIALPSFREFNIRMAVTSTTNDLVHAVTLARAEAAKRGTNVTVSATGSWTNGWTVETGGEIILQHAALGPVQGSGTVSSRRSVVGSPAGSC